MLFQVVPSVLLSMVALITTYFKESDWLLKNLLQIRKWLAMEGKTEGKYNVKEHKKLCQRQLCDPAFCLGPTIEKTNSALPLFCLKT